MKRRDLIAILEKNGFICLREGAEHTTYYKKGIRPIQVPRHREINEITAKEILKEAGLK